MFNIQSFRKGRRIHLMNGLISYWTMQETSGVRVDSLGVNNLTDHNGVLFSAGIIGNAASFVSASSQYLDVSSNASNQLGDVDFTFAFWVYYNSNISSQAMISKWASATQGFYIGLEPSVPGIILSATNASNVNHIVSTGSVPANGTWNFIVAWYDSVADLIQIQRNNGAVNATSHSGGVKQIATPFNISGINGFSTYFMDGRIDEVGFWNRVLSAPERNYLYNSGAGRTYPLPS